MSVDIRELNRVYIASSIRHDRNLLSIALLVTKICLLELKKNWCFIILVLTALSQSQSDRFLALLEDHVILF